VQQATTNPISSGRANSGVVAVACKGFIDCNNELYLIFQGRGQSVGALDRPD